MDSRYDWRRYRLAHPNVWTLDVAGQSWTALSDISNSGTSLAAGQGFLSICI